MKLYSILVKFSCIMILVLFLSCQGNQETNLEGNHIILKNINLISINKPLAGQNIIFNDSTVLGPLTDFCQITDRIYFFEQVVNNDCFGALVDIENQRILTKIGNIGKGPFELTNLFDFYKTEDSIYFFDLIANRLVTTSLNELADMTVRLSQENSKQYNLHPDFYVDLLVILDDKWITRNYNFQKPDSALVELMPYTLKSKKYFGTLTAFATDKRNDPRLRLVENLAYSAVHPNKKKFVLAYRFKDLIEVYNAKGEIIKSITGPTNNFPELSESTITSFDPISVYEKTWYSYKKVLAKEDAFYAGYVGKKEPPADAYSEDGLIDKKYTTSSFTYILKFNWEGEILARYELDEPVASFEVDEENHFIYCTSGYVDEGILRFQY